MNERVVLDTNIFISAAFWKGNPHIILEKAIDHQFDLFVSQEIIAEIKEALTLDFSLRETEIDIYIESVINFAQLVEPKERLQILNSDGDRILECAVESKADFIVTGDNHLLKLREFRKIRILSPKEFLMLQH